MICPKHNFTHPPSDKYPTVVLAKAEARKARRDEKAKTLWPKKAKRKKSKSLPKLKKELWKLMSLVVRSWSSVCLACGNPTEVAAHIVPSNEGAATRFFLPNLYPCCVTCNGNEKWNRGKWAILKHPAMFGEDYVAALWDFSKTTFQVKKHWVLEQTERMKKLLGARP